MKLIDEITETLRQLTDAPDQYIYTVAYHVVSSTIGWAVCCVYLPRRPLQAKPNIWAMLAGAPGITRKSTVIGIAEYLIRESFKEAWRRQNPNLSEQELNKMAGLIFMEAGSPEGITDHIHETWGVVPVYVIISSEYGGVLLGMRSRDYMIGMLNLLSKLYYGEGGRTHLSKRGKGKSERYLPPGAYVTMLVGIQEPHQYITPEMLNQGLLRRILLVYAKPEDKQRWMPPLDLGRQMVWDQLDDIVQQLATLICEYDELMKQTGNQPIVTAFEGEVVGKINQYAEMCEKELIRNPESMWALYRQTWWEHLAKLAMVHAMASRHPRPGAGQYFLDVRESDYEKARRFLEMIEPRAREAISSIVARIVHRPVQEVSGGLELVHTLIAEAGEEGITTSELLRKSKIAKNELKEYVINLMEQGKVIAIRAKSGSRGRKPIMFFDTKYEIRALQKGSKITPEALKVLW